MARFFSTLGKAGQSERFGAVNRENIIQKSIQLLEPVLDDMGFELVDLEYLSEHGKWVLRIYMDRRNSPVTVDDCARVSREVGDLIDVKEIIPHEYVLEVSSPGLHRPLKRKRDFSNAVGKKVKVKARVPVGGRRKFTGRLQELREDRIYIEVGGRTVEIPLDNIEKANLEYQFE